MSEGGVDKEKKGRDALQKARRWVVKVGSSLVTDDGRGLDQRAIAHWADQLVTLQQQGK